MLESYHLFENVQQAKKFLKDNNLDLNDPSINGWYEQIKDLLKNNINYMGLFVKFFFTANKDHEVLPVKKGDDDKYFDSLTGLLKLIKNQTNLGDFLPKPIVQYNTFEELSDDITTAQDDIVINNFYKNIYSNLRSDINIKDVATRNTILSYAKLDDETKKSMTPMVSYRKKSGQDYINDLSEFVETLGSSKEAIKKKIESLGNAVETVYDKDNIIVVRTFDKNAIKELGSKRWCIVYAQDSYYNSYCSPLRDMTQYIVFDFNKPSTDNNSLFGLSVDSSNTVRNGSSQNKANNYVSREEILKQTGIPDNIIVPHDFDKNSIKRAFSPDELIKLGKGREYYNQQEIDALNLDHDMLVRYKLLTPEQYNELSWGDKFIYKDFKLSDEEIETIKALSFEDKMKIEMNILRTIKAFTPEEYARLSWTQKYSYNGNTLSNKEVIEVRKLSVKEKKKIFGENTIQSLKLYSPKDYSDLTWNERYVYNDNSFTEEDKENLKNVPFSKRLQITDLLDDVFDLESEEMQPDDADLKVDVGRNYITFKVEHEAYPLMEIVGMDESEFYDFVDTQGYQDMYHEDEYIANYLDDSILKKIEELMDLLGYEIESGLTISTEGVIKEFFEEYNDYMNYDGGTKQHGMNDTLRHYGLDDIVSDVGSGIDSAYSDLIGSINRILPYTFDSREVELPEAYIEDLAEENEINNIQDLINSVDSVNDIISEHNKKVEKEEDKIEELYEYTRYNVGVAEYELKSIADNLQSIIDYIDENPDTSHILKNKEILKKLGFTKEVARYDGVTKGDIKIKILEKNFKEGKVMISRYNTKTQKSEKGWVKISNLNDYFSRTLFESKIITDFDEFMLW